MTSQCIKQIATKLEKLHTLDISATNVSLVPQEKKIVCPH